MNNSKGAIFAAVAAIALTFGITSCDKDLLNVNVPMQFSEITFDVPVTPLAGEFSDSTTVTTNIDSLLNANNVKKGNIKSIKLESLNMECVNGGDSLNNFRLIESVKGSIAKDGGAYTEVASLSNNPDVAAYTLNVPVNTTTDYRSYLDGSTFSFKVSGMTRGPVLQPLTIKAKLKFKIEAGI